MADKKKTEEPTEDKKKAKEEGEADTPEKAKNRSKTAILAGIAGVLLIGILVGGFFAYKSFAARKPAEAALAASESNKNAPVAPAADAHAAPAADTHAAPAADAHGAPAANAEAASVANAKGTPASEDKKASEGEKNDLGEVFALPKMELNVGGANLNRGFVRVTISLEYFGGEKTKAELESRTHQYKDIIIEQISSADKNDLLTASGRNELRSTLLRRVNEINQHPIKSLYFTEFLVE